MKIVKCQYNLVQLQRIGREAKKLITFNIRSLFFYLGLFSWLESVINSVGGDMGLVLSVPTVLMGLSRSLHIINTSNSCKVSEDTEGADVSELKKHKY